jgi:hypothetical protein
MRLGLVADLHGHFDPLLPRVLAGVDRILVAGDIGSDAVLGHLRGLAQVEAVRGNVDETPDLLGLPEFRVVAAHDRRILLAHNLHDRRLPVVLAQEKPDILLVGHSHRPLVSHRGDLLLVNPGSAGPKRFSLPRTAGVLRLDRGRPPEVTLWDLERDAPFPLDR